MKQLYKASIVLLLMFCVHSLSGQSISPFIFNAAGGSYDNPSSYYRFEWSLGELTVIDAMAPADSSLLVTHGVLQPCTEKYGTSPYLLDFDQGDIKIFPNPTTGRFEVDFFVRQVGTMDIQLTDATGRLIEKRTYPYNGCCRIEYFNLSNYPNGVYYVIVTLTPDSLRPGDYREVKRHGGYRILKMDNK